MFSQDCINNFNLKTDYEHSNTKNVNLYWIFLSHVLDQYYGFVTLKDFELPGDGFD